MVIMFVPRQGNQIIRAFGRSHKIGISCEILERGSFWTKTFIFGIIIIYLYILITEMRMKDYIRYFINNKIVSRILFILFLI